MCLRVHWELQLEPCRSFWEHHQAQLGLGNMGTVPLPQEPALSLPRALDPLQELSRHRGMAREPWHCGMGLCHESVALGVTSLD